MEIGSKEGGCDWKICSLRIALEGTCNPLFWGLNSKGISISVEVQGFWVNFQFWYHTISLFYCEIEAGIVPFPSVPMVWWDCLDFPKEYLSIPERGVSFLKSWQELVINTIIKENKRNNCDPLINDWMKNTVQWLHFTKDVWGCQ